MRERENVVRLDPKSKGKKNLNFHEGSYTNKKAKTTWFYV